MGILLIWCCVEIRAAKKRKLEKRKIQNQTETNPHKYADHLNFTQEAFYSFSDIANIFAVIEPLEVIRKHHGWSQQIKRE